MFQVLSHFERCPGFDKKRYVKKIAGGVCNVEDFCACTKFFDVCRRMANAQSVRSPNATRTVCSSAVRLLFGFNTVAYVEQNCGHTVMSFELISNVLVTYHYRCCCESLANELRAWCVSTYAYRIANVLLTYENELAYDGI